MKTQWPLILGPVLALGVACPLLAHAQQKPLPVASGTNAPAVAPAATAPAMAAPASAPPALSSWAQEIAKLAHAGIQDDVMLAFIDGTEGTFNLTADQIIYLKTLGVSSQAIASMMRHDGEINSGIRTIAASTVPASPSTLRILYAPPIKPQQAGYKPAKEPSAEQDGANLPGTLNAEAVAHESEASEPVVESPAEWDVDLANFGESPGIAQPRIARSSEIYPVRQPYVEEVTDPIFVFKASGRTPNIVVIEFSP